VGAVVKLPLPPAELHYRPGDFHRLGNHVLWRIHRTSGEHVVAWNALRYWGPATAARFDPQPPPPSISERGVSYAALDVPTALAEVFQQTRVINTRRADPFLTAWRPTRSLQLLDITGEWPIRNGASFTLNTGPRDYSRAWARAIHGAWPELDGLWHRSSMTGQCIVTLFTHAADSFPARPLFSAPLGHPGLRADLLAAADQIGFRTV
jgi:hypothetical protein